MGRIRGHYEWDDDDLTPGRKKEGGLHQNLFDSDGNLKGSARFVPLDEGDPDSVYDMDYDTENVEVAAHQRLTPEEIEQLGKALEALFKGIVWAAPHVAKWWKNSFRPFVRAQSARLSQLHPKGKLKDGGPLPISVIYPEESDQATTEDAVDSSRPNMTSAEAQVRYLAAMAARAFSEEQMRMVQSANVIGADAIAEVSAKIAQLPPDEVRELISKMVTYTSTLPEGTLADLERARPPARRELRQPPARP